MNISTETREILRNYKAVINARRREMGQKPLTTAQIVDEICDFVVNQQAVFLGGHYILQGSRNRGYRAGGGGRLSARAKTPGRLAPAGREAGHAGASPVTLPVCDVSGMFFPDVMFLWLLFFFFLFFPFLSCLCLFRASPWRGGLS